MIQPDKVREAAKKKEKQNYRFRTYLKCDADEETLDRQFLTLHNELFAEYDCSKCRNCCKQYRGSIPVEDLPKDAKYLKITEEQFIAFFLQADKYGIQYQTKNMPCDFLEKDGS